LNSNLTALFPMRDKSVRFALNDKKHDARTR
jgi:hypothetical protein